MKNKKYTFTLKELATDQRVKLTAEQKLEILSLKDKLKVSEIAKYYNVSTSLIRNILDPVRMEKKKLSDLKYRLSNPSKTNPESHNRRVAKLRLKNKAINEGLI